MDNNYPKSERGEMGFFDKPLPERGFFEKYRILTARKLCFGLLLFFTHLATTSAVPAQILTIKEKNMTLKTFMDIVTQKTKYRFVYTNEDLALAKSLNFSVENRSIESILNTYFQDQPIDYKVVDNTVVLSRKAVKKASPGTTSPSVAKPVQARVTGKVLAQVGSNQEPSGGVTVQVKGTQRRTFTNDAGTFSIEAKTGEVLVFTSVGYQTREILVSSPTAVLNVVLQEGTEELDQVVVTGYQTQERRTITGAMGQVTAEDFEDMPIQTVDQAMQGRMAGVLVQGGSGVPGGEMRIEIRGVGSITAGTEPLYIVDGVEINNEIEDRSDVSSSSPLSSIDPEDIESIEVLKDAAAASIYGAQAANGVVLITTKKGASGKTRINLNYYKGIREPMPLLEVMNSQQYLRSRMEAVAHLNPNWTSEEVRTTVLSQSQLSTTLTDAEIAALPTYDWQSETFKIGYTDNASATISGGTQGTTFRLSSSFNKTDATVVGNDFLRGTARLRVDHEVNKKLSFSGNINLSTVTQNSSYQSNRSGSYFSSPQHMAPQMLPFIPIYNEDGSYNASGDTRFPGQYPYNAIHAAEVNTIRTKTQGLTGVLSASYNINRTLRWQSRVGLDYRVMGTELYFDPRTQQVYGRGGTKNSRMQTSSTLTTSHTLTYNKSLFGGHNLNGLLGVEYRGYHRHRLGAFGEGFPSHDFRYLSSAAVFGNVLEDIAGNKRAGAFGQVNYNYMKKYMFSAVLRRDGSSKFGADHRWGWFPSVSAGWDMAQENFLRSSRVVQQMKFRASYGHTGNSSVGNFAALALWSGGGSYAGRAGTWRSQLGNDDLRWERNISTNAGLDFSMFRRRLYGSIDAYHRLSDDLLLLTPISNLSGFSTVYRNTGAVVNRGIELELNSNVIRRGAFRWRTGANVSFNRNKVIRLYRGIAEDIVDPDSDIEVGEMVGEEITVLPGNAGIRVGYPMRTNWRYQYAGVNAASGKPMWWQGEDRLTYAPTGSWSPFSRGNRLSDYFGGFHNRFTYKGVELGIFFQFDAGRELYNSTNTYLITNGANQSNSLRSVFEERWTTPGQITTTPRPIDGGAEELANQMNRASSLFLEDASYMRLKEVSLNWRVPNKHIRRFRLENMTIYARALNLMTFTKWSGYDPEFYVDDSNFETNTGQIPQARTFTIGIKAGI